MYFKNAIYIILSSVVLFMFCSTPEKKENTKPSVEKPKIISRIDSNAFRKEIYRLDTVLKPLFKNGNLNGSVLVAKKGQIIYYRTQGICNKTQCTPLSDSSLFQLASISKVFTATAIMLLYEKDSIKLTERVCTYLPTFPYKTITVQDLLCHRSGLPNYLYALKDSTFNASNSSVLKHLVDSIPNLYFKPNTRFNYCNTNYAILALILESISKKPYNTFLNDEIFEPLSMKHTGFKSSRCLDPTCFTTSYNYSWQPVCDKHFDNILGDKGIYSTAYDLFLFSEALFQNKLLKAETQQLMYAPYSPERKMGNYGYGWRMKNFNSKDKEVFHNGWWHGYRTAFHRWLKDDITIIVLSNRLNKNVYNTQRLYNALRGTTDTKMSPEDE